MNTVTNKDSIHEVLLSTPREISHACAVTVRAYTKSRMKANASFKHKIKGDVEANNNLAYVDFLNDHDIANTEYSPIDFFNQTIWGYNQELLTDNAEEVSEEIYESLGDQTGRSASISYSNPEQWLTIYPFTDLHKDSGDDEYFIKMSLYHAFGVSPILHTVATTTAVVENTNNLLMSSIVGSFVPIMPDMDNGDTYKLEGFQLLRRQSFVKIKSLSNSTPLPTDYLTMNWFIEPDYYDTTPFFEKAEEWSMDVVSAKKTLHGYIGTPIFTDINNRMLDYTEYPECFFAPQTKNGSSVKLAHMEVVWGNGNGQAGIGYNVTGKRFTNKISKYELSDNNYVSRGIAKGQVARWDYPPTSPSSSLLYDSITMYDKYHKCYTGTLNCEPYHEMTPISDGAVVACRFVNKDNLKPDPRPPVGYSGNGEPIFLSIEAPFSFIRELNQLLEKSDYNTDIIHTVKCMFDQNYSIKSTPPNGSPYWRFGHIYYKRNDNDIDYVINGDGGAKIPTRFLLSNTGIGVNDGSSYDFPVHRMIDTSKYDKCVIAGIAEISSAINSRQSVYNLYLTNHNAYNDDYKEFMIPMEFNFDPDDAEKVSYLKVINVEDGELLRPMVHFPGYKGNIKIMKVSSLPAHKISKKPNGMATAVYEIEVPYAVGASSVHSEIAYSQPFHSQVSYTSQYIPAGSEAINANGHKRIFNQRDAYYGSELIKNPMAYQDCEDLDQSSVPASVRDIPSHFLFRKGTIKEYTAYITRRNFTYTPDSQMLSYHNRIKLVINIDDGSNSDFVMAFTPNTSRYYNGSTVTNSFPHETPAMVGKFDISAITKAKDMQDPEFASLPDQKIFMSPEARVSAKTKFIYADYPILQLDCVHHISNSVKGSVEELKINTEDPENIYQSGSEHVDQCDISGTITGIADVQCVIEVYNKTTEQWERVSDAPFDFLRNNTEEILTDIDLTASVPSPDLYNMHELSIVDIATLEPGSVNQFDEFMREIINPSDYYILNNQTGYMAPILYIAHPNDSVISNATLIIPSPYADRYPVGGDFSIFGVKGVGYDVTSYRETTADQVSTLTSKYLDIRGGAYYNAEGDIDYSHIRIRPRFLPTLDMMPVKTHGNTFEMRKMTPLSSITPDIDTCFPVLRYDTDKLAYYPENIIGRNAVLNFTVKNFHIISK